MCNSRYFVLTACVLLTAATLGASTSRADLILYTATLSGAGESPPDSPGTGSAQIDYDSVAHTLRVQAAFSGLLGDTTASHIHSPTLLPGTGSAGVAVPSTGFPLGVKSGSYDHTFDMTLASTYSAFFLASQGGTPASAEAFLASSFAAGTSYLNLHTNLYPGGEIRGFLQPVPEPSTFAMAGAAVVGLLAWGWRRRITRECCCSFH